MAKVEYDRLRYALLVEGIDDALRGEYSARMKLVKVMKQYYVLASRMASMGGGRVWVESKYARRGGSRYGGGMWNHAGHVNEGQRNLVERLVAEGSIKLGEVLYKTEGEGKDNGNSSDG